MNIDMITVDAQYCFGVTPLQLNELGKVNFIFAANGSGKTTISSALAAQPKDATERQRWSVAPTDHPIRVFNEEYRSRVLTEHVDGIFTVGSESKEINEQIEALIESRRQRSLDRDQWKKEIGSDDNEEGPSGLMGDLERERLNAREIFEEHKSLPNAVIKAVFQGYRTNKDKFLEEALRRFSEGDIDAGNLDWAELEQIAETLDGDTSPRESLPVVSVLELVSDEEIDDLLESSSARGAGAFSDMIRSLGNEDWVSKGREYVPGADGKCPFCQGERPKHLLDSLRDHFASGFDAALGRAREIAELTRTKAGKLDAELTALEKAVSNNSEVDEKAFTASISSVRNAKDLLLTRVEEKEEHPTRSVEAVDIGEASGVLRSLIERENEKIRQYNILLSDTKAAQAQLVEDGWNLFISDRSVSTAIKRYCGVRTKKRHDIEVRQGKIRDSLKSDRQDNARIKELQDSVSNTAAVAERINKLLLVMGFHRFSVEVADAVSGGYRIVREDGSTAVGSLSEGEKSFICFAYFWESLAGNTVAGVPAEDVVAVIDDPISSLDSDTLFIVAAYIRDAAQAVIKGESNIRQMIILTHNTQFHHEAAYVSNFPNAQDRHYYRLLKGSDGLSYVRDDKNRCRIRGSYPLLWDSIVEAAKDENESSLVKVGVVNIVRRIIEGYFRTIGNVKDLDRIADLDFVDGRALSTFLIWANAGSHTIADDVDQTIGIGDTEQFLRLFQRFFDLQEHSAHFDMMIRASSGEELLEPGALFGR